MILARALDRSLDELAARAPGGIVALDAGCGRASLLRHRRDRIARLVGVDIHRPESPLLHLDDFRVVDMCTDGGAFEDGTFDLILSNFTLEHLPDPQAAMTNLRRWLRPGGTLVASTVNRRHPFVAAYLGLPTRLRTRIQPLIKADAADAHPLVGICNDPDTIRRALELAGFERIEATMVGNLAHAWRRRWPTFIIGLIGDLLARAFPSRRSTIVVIARRP
jgi:SAM-dependent methyltransferase